MKHLNKTVVASAVAAALLTSSAAMAGVTANIGVASNYIWRGVTQTDNASAVSGGIDFAESGFKLGTWVSNTTDSASGFEQDLYGAYGFTAGPVDLEVGYIAYTYPVSTTSNFNEVYVTAGMKGFSLGAYIDSANSNNYYSVGYQFEAKKDLNVALTYGMYDFKTDSSDYSHITASISKSDFKFAYDTTSGNGKKAYSTFTASWSKSFDL